MPRFFFRFFAILAITLIASVGVADEPATAAATSAPAAEITGTLKTADTVTRIAAVDRPWANVLKTSQGDPKDPFLYNGRFDAKTGAFTIPGLLPGHTYDLIIWTENAAHEKIRWEGADMDYHRVILPAGPVTADDQKWLADFVKNMASFYNKSRILHLAADHKHATVLVELAHTTEFHSGKKGDIIYRVELWYFENYFGGWAKDNNTERVLVRIRCAGDALPKFWQFLPQLGGITLDSNGKTPSLNITLPAKPTANNGLAGKIP